MIFNIKLKKWGDNRQTPVPQALQFNWEINCFLVKILQLFNKVWLKISRHYKLLDCFDYSENKTKKT